MLEPKLISLMACPQCQGVVEEAEDGARIVCRKCRLAFPVRNGVPLMMVSEALRHTGRERDGGAPRSRHRFRVTHGPHTGLIFDLEDGCCKAVGRGEAEQQLPLAIDETTRSLIMAYISKQFREQSPARGAERAGIEQLGAFHRQPDESLHDPALSRLHVMFFAALGQVGILDLVSKNGTYVNGVEVESRLLRPGEVVEIGETKIVFEA